MSIQACYLAPEGLEEILAEEIARSGRSISQWHGRLALSPEPPMASLWALDVWTAPREIPITSVKSAADALRAMQRNWSSYGVEHFRRIALITDKLPPLKSRLLVFPEPAPSGHLGAWTLLAPNLMLASPSKSSPFINGECLFQEDHIGPPSRAYLKLWEACTRLGVYPAPGDVCLDLGASPGGWTWVAASLGAAVTAIDRAKLADKVAAMPGVSQRQGNAFTLPPEPVDWLLSDIIAYPAPLLELVQRWIAAGTTQRIICTIKLQGATDHDAVANFVAIPGAQVMHLLHNKHELTFYWQKPDAASDLIPASQ